MPRIIDYITRSGDRMRWQLLSESLDGAALRNGGETALTFRTRETSPIDVVDRNSKVIGIVLWLPRDACQEVDREAAEARKGETAPLTCDGREIAEGQD